MKFIKNMLDEEICIPEKIKDNYNTVISFIVNSGSEDPRSTLFDKLFFDLSKELIKYNDANLITRFFKDVYEASISSNEGEADKSQDFLSQALKSSIKASKKYVEENSGTYYYSPIKNIELYKQALSVIKDDDKKIAFGISQAEFYIGESQRDDNEYEYGYVYNSQQSDSIIVSNKDYSNSFGQAFYSSTSNIDFEKVADRVSKMDSNKNNIGHFIDGFKSGLRKHEIIDNVSMGLALGLGFGACATALGVGIVATAPAIAVVASTTLIGATVGAGIGYVVSEVKATKLESSTKEKIEIK